MNRIEVFQNEPLLIQVLQLIQVATVFFLQGDLSSKSTEYKYTYATGSPVDENPKKGSPATISYPPHSSFYHRGWGPHSLASAPDSTL